MEHNPCVRVYREGMESLTFVPGGALLESNSSVAPWRVVFEDEGVAGYFYACDRSRNGFEDSILDAMLIYNVDALRRSDAELARPEPQRIAAIEWSRDGLRAMLYLDGMPQALYDFQAKCGYCRMNFPNFMADDQGGWRKDSHAWNEAAVERFETELYGVS